MAAPAAVTSVQNTSNDYLPRTWTAQNPKKTKWMVIEIQYTSAGGAGGNFGYYKFSYRIYTNSGELTKGPTVIGQDKISLDTYNTEAKRKAQAKNEKFYKEAVALLKSFSAGTFGNPQGDSDSEEDLGNWDTPIVAAALERVNYNPPPHKSARPTSFYFRANIGSDVKDKTKSDKILPLGRIYQTESTAKALNKMHLARKPGHQYRRLTDEKLTDFIRSGYGLWGFRFLYNPNSLQISSQVNSGIDWVLNQQDPSRFFGGNTTITFDLYLNRIPDLASLGSKGNLRSREKDYGKALTQEELEGLYYRGTEYDIDFLYRCINGSPIRTSLTSEGLPVSDFGYVTGSPVWLHLHDNLRYKASLTGIQVNHVTFSDRMVPMLSIVRLSFVRYPELEAIGDKDSLRENLGKFIGSSSEETPPGTTGTNP